jgi:hypothetical protein
VTAHLLRAALVLAALSAPLVEHGARAQARTAVSRCADGTSDCGGLADWDLDADGLRLVGIERELAGARWSAARVHVGLDRRGLAIDVFEPARAASTRPHPVATAAAPAPARTAEPPRIDLHGLSATVRVHGRLSVPLPHGVVAHVVDPVVAIDDTGHPRAAASATLVLPDDHRLAIALARVEPSAAGRWRVAATAALDDGPPVAIAGELSSSAVQLRARAAGDATLAIEATRGSGAPTLAVQAHAWPLATVGPRVVDELDARGVEIADAVVDGDVALASDGTVSATGLVVRGLGVDDPRLANRAVRVASLAIDGVGQRNANGFRADATFVHEGARVHTDVTLDGDRLRLTAELAELPCQALLAAMPDGMSDALAGARLAGSVAGSVAVDVDLARLADIDLDVDPPPGTLAIDLPILESCSTTSDPPGIDLGGLAGPYRHVFVAGGRRRDRVLAPGAPGFVALANARRVANAFVALEDMRFRSHDGFDREQIERAFWHNLVAGGVRRGASTISQQTARNLWLGVDRSLARKLQEAWLTARLEATVDKDRILELYVNVIELGPGVFGVDEAARYHFGVAPEDLDALQAIHLASLAPAPRTLAKRFASGQVDDAWLAELRDHARRMHRNGMLDAGELAVALRSELRLRVHATADAAP